MNRYLKSFSLTALFYIFLCVTFLYSFDDKKIIQAQQNRSEQNVMFTIIQEKKVKEKTVKKVEKKEIHKKIQKKVINTKKTKPIVKKVEKKIVKKVERKKKK